MSSIEQLREYARSSKVVEKEQKISDELFDQILSSIRKDMTDTEVMSACRGIDVWDLTPEQNDKLYQSMPVATQKKILNYRRKFISFMEQFGNEKLDEDTRDQLFRIVSLVRAGYPFEELEKDDINFLLKILGPKYLNKFGKLLAVEDLFDKTIEEIQEFIKDNYVRTT